LRDQIYRLRGRPSLLLWAYASDIPPPPDVERSYLKVLKQLRWPNPALSSTEHIPTKVTGPSGVKEGVYQYVPPSFWLLAATPEVQKKAKRFDNTRAGAFGFTTETGPGPAPPPVESLRLFLPKEHLWPVDYWWNYHAGLHAFTTLDVFNHAMDMRYGKPRDLQDYTIKAQVMAYEGERAMFEAYNRNKYRSTGVIQWMLNNAWPGIIWHLYDYYLRPGGGYFGSKKALEPLHPQYSYDDNSVSLISSQYQDAKDLKLEAAVYNFDLSKSYYKRATVDAPADSSKRVFTLPQMEGQTTTYFLLLTLDDSSGKRLSSNLYWLSTKPDVMNWPKVTYSETPALQYGDFTSLNRLPKTSLRYSSETERQGDEFLTHVTIKNPGKNLAFFVRLKANSAATGDEILPVLWEDNYFSLLPGEERQITARHSASDVSTAKIAVTVEGWNVRPQ
jgi:exo-1,4-beta-D-glucosaminidase